MKLSPSQAALADLLSEVGKVAEEMGESWRLDHAELMDSYQAASDVLGNYLTSKGASE